jgi:hypothetical protein
MDAGPDAAVAEGGTDSVQIAGAIAAGTGGGGTARRMPLGPLSTSWYRLLALVQQWVSER